MITDVNKAISLELDYEKRLIKRVEKRLKQLERLPNINLIGVNRNGSMYYYLSSFENNKETRTYLNKHQQELRKLLQEKYCLSRMLVNCRENVLHLQKINEGLNPVDPYEIVKDASQAYQDQDNAAKIVYGCESESRWKRAKLAEKNQYPNYRMDELRHTAGDGTKTRSKSEAMIIDLLNGKGIQYVYEFPMRFNGQLKSPDFIIWDKKGNREIIIEHLGLMNDLSYRSNQYDKIGVYIEAGYVPNVNLLLTFDDKDGNINIPSISRMIDAILS